MVFIIQGNQYLIFIDIVIFKLEGQRDKVLLMQINIVKMRLN